MQTLKLKHKVFFSPNGFSFLFCKKQKKNHYKTWMKKGLFLFHILRWTWSFTRSPVVGLNMGQNRFPLISIMEMIFADYDLTRCRWIIMWSIRKGISTTCNASRILFDHSRQWLYWLGLHDGSLYHGEMTDLFLSCLKSYKRSIPKPSWPGEKHQCMQSYVWWSSSLGILKKSLSFLPLKTENENLIILKITLIPFDYEKAKKLLFKLHFCINLTFFDLSGCIYCINVVCVGIFIFFNTCLYCYLYCQKQRAATCVLLFLKRWHKHLSYSIQIK